MKTKVAAYCRVSTKDEEQLKSLNHQQNFFNREFGGNESYELYRVYADRGLSGTKLSRPAFDEMIKDAGIDKTRIENDLYAIVAKPKFSRILVKNTSRFARNLSVDMLIKTLAKNSVYIDFVDTNLSTENPSDSIALGVLQLLDQEESKDKSRKTKFGMIEGAKKGTILCTNKIYGYTYYPCPINRLEIIPHEAKIIKMMFDMYLEGIGAYRISGILAQMSVLNRNGKPFTEGSIRSILSNEKYCGLATRMKYDTGVVFAKHSKTIRDKSEQIIFQTDKVPAIVSKEDFDRVQELRFSKVQHQIQKGINHGSTDYAQKVICGCCGTQYRATTVKHYAKKSTRYYACVLKRQMHKDENGNRVMLCNNPNVTEEKLDSLLNSTGYSFRIWNRVKAGIQEINSIITALKSRIDTNSQAEVKALEIQLAEVVTKKEKLLDLYLSDTFTKAQLDERAKPLDIQESELLAKIKALSKSNDEIYADIAEVEQTMQFLQEQNNVFQQDFDSGKVAAKMSRKEMLKDIESIVVGVDGELIVNFKAYAEIERLLEKHRHII